MSNIIANQAQIMVMEEQLHTFCKDALTKVGVPATDAMIVATTFVESNLYGVDSHGVMRLPGFLPKFKAGGTRPLTDLQTVSDYPAALVLDANFGIGQVASYRAMEMAIVKAKSMGIAAVSVRNSSHFGRAGHYSMMALEHGMIGIAISNTNLITSTGSSIGAAVGNNPWSVAIPAGAEMPVVLDMACSVVSVGKIMGTAAAGEKAPRGWGLDANGALTDDPESILEGGSLLPFGGYKGFGIALIMGVLSGVLSGSGSGRVVPMVGDDPNLPSRVGHLFIAIDIAKFTDLKIFKDEMDTMIRRIKALPNTVPDEPVRLPGERLFKTYHIRKSQGIPIPISIIAKLKKIAQELGVKVDF